MTGLSTGNLQQKVTFKVASKHESIQDLQGLLLDEN